MTGPITTAMEREGLTDTGYRSVQAYIWYLARLELYKTEKPYMITFDTSNFDGAKTNHKYSEHETLITDIREYPQKFQLDIHGFRIYNWAQIFCQQISTMTKQFYRNTTQKSSTIWARHSPML